MVVEEEELCHAGLGLERAGLGLTGMGHVRSFVAFVQSPGGLSA